MISVEESTNEAEGEGGHDEEVAYIDSESSSSGSSDESYSSGRSTPESDGFMEEFCEAGIGRDDGADGGVGGDNGQQSSSGQVAVSRTAARNRGGRVWKSGKSIPDMMAKALEGDDESTLKDAVFLVGNEKISAHRLFLSIASPVFFGLFYHNNELMQHVGKVNITLPPEIQPRAFRLLLRYIYCRSWEPNVEDALELLRVANKFKFEELACSCRSELRSALDPQNAALYLQRGMDFDQRLKDLALDVILDTPVPVFATEEFLSLSREALEEILKSDHLAASEVQIFTGAVRWADHSIRSKMENPDVKIPGAAVRNELGACLFLIRFPLMSQLEFIINVVARDILNPTELSAIFLNHAVINAADDDTCILLSQSLPHTESEALFSNKKRVPRKNSRVNSPPTEQVEALPRQAETVTARQSARIDQGNAGQEALNTETTDSDGPPAKTRRIQTSAEEVNLNAHSSEKDMVEDGQGDVDATSTSAPSDLNESENTCARTRSADIIDDEVPGPSGSIFPKPQAPTIPGNSSTDEVDAANLMDGDTIRAEVDDDNFSLSPQSGSSLLSSPASEASRTRTRNISSNSFTVLTQEQKLFIQENSSIVSPENANLSNIFAKYEAMSKLEEDCLWSITEIWERAAVVIDENGAQSTYRLNFPGLKLFHVEYLKDVKSTGELKAYLKKLDLLRLFFVQDSAFLQELWTSRLKTKITVNGITLLKTDFEEKSIVMRQLQPKYVESILVGLAGTEVKTVVLRSCEVDDLNVIPTENLQKLILSQVTGLKNNYNYFLSKCLNLEILCFCNNQDSTIHLQNLGFTTGRSKLRKLAVKKVTLLCPRPDSTLNNLLEELYLDMCVVSAEFIEDIPKIFPRLKKVRVYKKIGWKMLWKFLQIPSLEWIAVWGIETRKPHRGHQAQDRDYKHFKDFMNKVGLANYTSSFILTKTLAEGPLQLNLPTSDITSSAAEHDNAPSGLDSIMNENEHGLFVWDYMKIRQNERFAQFNLFDFQQFELSYIYPDVDYYIQFDG